MLKITDNFANHNRNLGNKLFTYAVSKIIADKYGYKLVIPNNSLIQRNNILTDFPFKSNDGIIINNPEYYISDHSMYDKGFDNVLTECKDKNVFLDGYFLKYDYVKKYKNKIKNLYNNLTSNFDNKNDVIILLRDSNNDGSFKLPDNYYLDILSNLNFDKLYISYDHIEKHKSLIDSLSNYSPILLDLDIIELFKYITSKKTIIGCQGTFSFWACWLSNAEKIYWPLTTIGPNNPEWCVNLTVDDDDRYTFIKITNNE
jgi:hypothetical protein